MVRAALARRGHDVLEAADGRTAREIVAREQPRLVLQDLMLPDADGFELVIELRELCRRELSILAFSGFVSQVDEARISSVGFDDIIHKPIAPSRLVPLVEAHLPQPASNAERFGDGRRLVIADDDPIQLKLAAFRLGRLGFAVEPVPDGAAALAAVRSKRPDVIVSDVMMPELDGFGLAMALRQDPALHEIPLVLVTSSYVEPSDRELARRAGASELVVRTPDLGELIELLRVTLSHTHAPPELPPESLPELERERIRRVMRQLERQVLLNAGLAKRCSILSSELTVLTGIAEAVLKHRDVDAAIDEALASCFDAGGVSVGALYLLGEGGALRVRALGGDAAWSASELPGFFGQEPVLRQVIASGQLLYLPSEQLAPEVGKELLARCSASALLVVPLVGNTGPLGALLMVARGREHDEEDWRAFALAVGSQISQVLTLARAYADREAAERVAAGHAALLEAVVESAPDYVIQLDRDGVIRLVSRTETAQGVDALVGTPWLQHIPVDQVEKTREVLDAVMTAGTPAEVEIHLVLPDGTSRWYQSRLGPVRDEDRIVGCVVVARDVTEKKQTEMQLMLADRMASVGTLAAGVAHEINNPLASVIANLDMAVEDLGTMQERVELPADLVEELRDARSSAERVREIVRDLKIFSRSNEERRGAVDVEKVLESTLRMAWNELRHRAKLVKSYGKVPKVDANESRLGQVFLNLIVNAVQAIPEGNFEGNEIRISTKLDGDRVVVGIRDTGAGIPPEVQRRLFTPFFTTKPVGVGTGLGLAISHRIITSLGGDISFESELGAGTEFKVVLPVSQGMLPVPTQRVPKPAPAKRRGRVLVIDDEESLAHAIRRYLAQAHHVEALTSGRLAIDRLASGERYDVILCDLMMPQVTGMELHGAVLKIDPAQAEKIVFVSGGAFTAAAREFLDAVPNRRIEKPFDLKMLRDLVNELVQ
jgi:PAS domain S-box-containing protein